jgi:hypothetical protein
MAAVDSSRKTFVISVRDQNGPATVEEVRTGRKARLRTIRDTAGQIERWLRDGSPDRSDPLEDER